ncbi:hypothetical protein [Ulvibacterium sp.]|uniref:hypothetical protein n=1 Tax=Ulvibacterium sp. TaxID=2665914 RepID=UPI003BAAAD2D
MRRAYVLFFLVLLLIHAGCEKNDNGGGVQKVEGAGQNNPEVPDAVSYDLNTDSVDDFQVDYNMGIWDGANASGFLVSATLESMNESTVLLKINEGINTEILFSMPKDSIWREPVEPFKWNEYGPVSIARLWQGADGIWPEEWSVNSEFNSNPYYLGIRVKENEDFLVGWIKLEINVTNGKIRFVEYQLTPEEYIVIPE